METRTVNGIVFSAALAAALAVGGCASSAPRPANTALTQAETAVSLAQQNNAAEFAALELRLAQENLEKARAAIQREEYDDAQRLAEQALADAQFAQAKAQAEAARKASDDVRESVETLKREVAR